MRSRVAVLSKQRHFEIQEQDLVINDEQILIKVAACGLCAWELNHWSGNYGDYPYILGHETAGVVVGTGKNVKGFQVGDRVSGVMEYGGFADYKIIEPEDIPRTFLLREHIDPKYAFSEPLKCVVTVLNAAAPKAGDVVVVNGCGPMGLWCIQALKGSFLSKIIAVDICDANLEHAKKSGASFCVNPLKENVPAAIAALTGGNMADVAIEGSGSLTALIQSADYMKKGRGRIVVMATYKPHAPLDIYPFINAGVEKSLEIVFAHPGYSMNVTEDTRRAVAYINDGVFNIKDMITHEFALEDINRAFKTLENRPQDYLKGVVVP